ncbi:polyprenyl diphosphate synthase [Streptomyces sp. NPDC048282]|uniref:polyprenyl diphosphate synthase n=1 Tax=Streptomyces sp. NPDC048282 TaxID=3365528 RepID=UPI003720F306
MTCEDIRPRTRTPLPRHLAVIMDGNRRWARERGLAPVDGHREGMKRLFDILEWSAEAGVEIVTLWQLSVDNLRRPVEELSELLPLIGREVDELAARQRWRINPIGRVAALPDYLRDALQRAAAATAELDGMIVNFAVAYDGRAELIDALCTLKPEDAVRVGDDPGSWQEWVTGHLYTAGQPDPDLIIRTSGEQRLSGFMIWQSAMAEYFFCDTYWPAFNRDDFDGALDSFAARARRYGR